MRRILETRRFSAPLASVMLILMTHAIWGARLQSGIRPIGCARDRVCASTWYHKASFLDSASDTVPTERSGGASSQACDHDGAPRQARRDGRVVCPHGCSLASCERGRLDRKTRRITHNAATAAPHTRRPSTGSWPGSRADRPG